MRAIGLTSLLILIALVRAGRFSAQVPSFDVSSIKPNVTAGDSVTQAGFNGRFTATRVSLRSLILRAYAIHDSQLIGAPAWVGAERFDVEARVEAAPPGGPENLMPMLRTLLGDRFRLRMHTEMRELPAFLLTLARRDRRLGPQVRATEADCTRATQLTAAEIRAQARDGWPPCGMVYTVSFVAAAATGLENKTRMRRSGISMKDFAATLQTNIDRPVVDRTGLEGRFDVEYSFAAAPATADAGGNQPTLLMALEEQLGLKLEAQRTEVPVLVIDSVDRLIEN